jgi:cullin-associated NEDD8-dissociated protein 1
MKPARNPEWADRVYDEAVTRLSKNDTDAEVRACAEDVIADLWTCATEVVKSKNKKEWEAICRTAGNTDGAVKVVTKVAKEVDIGDEWVNGCVEWLMVLMRKSGRSGKTDVFNALETLLRRYNGGIPVDLPPSLVPQIKNYVSTTDISLLSQSLSILALLLGLSPGPTFVEIERDVLTDIYVIAHSPLVSGTALDAILVFFAALVEADGQIATHVVPNLVVSAERAPKAESSPGNVAKCVAQVIKSQQSIAAGTIVEFSRHVKVCTFYIM